MRVDGLAHDHHLDEAFRFVAIVANVADPCCHILNYIETRAEKTLPYWAWALEGGKERRCSDA